MIAVLLLMFVPLFACTRKRPCTPLSNLMWACITVQCLSIAAALTLAQWRPL